LTDVETFDQPSFEAFTSGLVAAGFEPERGSNGSAWKGPIHPAFAGLTDATRMRIVVRDGWPYVFPVALVEGLHSHHLNEHGYVCLWHEGDGSGDWVTADGFFNRLVEWCDEARSGWDVVGLGRDAYLNFTNKEPAVATFDLDRLDVGTAGGWGDFHGALPARFRVDLGPRLGAPEDLRGLWFHAEDIEIPPRNLSELRSVLNGTQRKALDRALAKRRATDALEPSGSVDLVLFRWDRDEVRHLLVLAVSGGGKQVEMAALVEGPNDETSLLLRAGPDADALRPATAVIFGLGALGGHAAVCLASSGLGHLRLVDADLLIPGNVVRHVAGHDGTGVPKAYAVQVLVSQHAPWTEVETDFTNPRSPSDLGRLVEGADLVIDATGSVGATASLAAIAAITGKPLLSAALYRGGYVARVQRQGTPGDTPLGLRARDGRYPQIPPGADEDDLVEPAIGCSAPVNNAPPSSVLACAATIAQSAVDVLTGRCELSDEIIDVYRPLIGEPPFDQAGRLTSR
jgi:molybdopterin/thiamine biosynthesis adenylyltransferase